jgi:hypothetical protein
VTVQIGTAEINLPAVETLYDWVRCHLHMRIHGTGCFWTYWLMLEQLLSKHERSRDPKCSSARYRTTSDRNKIETFCTVYAIHVSVWPSGLKMNLHSYRLWSAGLFKPCGVALKRASPLSQTGSWFCHLKPLSNTVRTKRSLQVWKQNVMSVCPSVRYFDYTYAHRI